MDPATGALSVLRVLDYEALGESERAYTFTVEAADAGGSMPPGLASVTVTITVRGAASVSRILFMGQKIPRNRVIVELIISKMAFKKSLN